MFGLMLMLAIATHGTSAAQAAPAPTAGDLKFPEGFVWGTATAAVQCEGDTPHSDWASFEQRPGAIRDNHRIGKAACHFDRYEEDFAAARAMHTGGYRFSLEWSRLEPQKGQWDAPAARRYRAMLESLKAKGIRPMVTLHHFSNPQWVADQGGWTNPATITDFERFSRRCARAFGDLVDDWVTINEPGIYATEGYIRGTFPPGRQNDWSALPVVFSHLIKAHGRAYRVLHAEDTRALAPGGRPCRVGVAEHMIAYQPATPWNPLDRLVAFAWEEAMNYAFLDAATTGRLHFQLGTTRVNETHAWLAGTLDYVGVNYYSCWRVAGLWPLTREVPRGAPKTELGLEIYPDGLYEVLAKTHARYGLPIRITETGISDASREAVPGFMVQHLVQVRRAIDAGIPVQGVYWWSLMDNFEWQNGYHGRFGLLSVDFGRPELPRAWTPGAHAYAAIAKRNAIPSHLLAQYARPKVATGL